MIASKGLPIKLTCRVVGVSESGYYDWRERAPSPRTIRHAWLTDVIRQIHAESFGVYGAPRVHAELTLGRVHERTWCCSPSALGCSPVIPRP